jgi:hypothetical protein
MIRAHAVEYADSLVGLGGTQQHDHATQVKTADILFPFDPKGARLNMVQTKSNCMLVCLAVLREIGVDHELLQTPHGHFPPGSNMATGFRDPCGDLLTIARDKRALLDIVTTTKSPKPGDMFVIGSGLGTHGLTLRSYSPLDGIVESVDGGQGERGAAIEYSSRRLGWDNDQKKYWLYAGEDKMRRDRPVNFWIDLEALL